MIDDIYPDKSESIYEAVQRISGHIGCPQETVERCMDGLDFFWNTPEHLNDVRIVTHAFNESAKLASRLARSMQRMTEDQLHGLSISGAVTLYQIQHLAAVLMNDATSLKEMGRTVDRKGGRNPAAYDVATLVRRVFRRLSRPITYGQSPDSGGPSTPFGRAVEFALGAFGIRADWRGPARQEYDNHQKILFRRRFFHKRIRRPNKKK